MYGALHRETPDIHIMSSLLVNVSTIMSCVLAAIRFRKELSRW